MFAAALLLLSAPAHAVGIGSTAGIGTGGLFSGATFFDFRGSSFAPTLDIHANPVLVQIHVLEFTEALVDEEELYLGANVLFAAHEGALTGPWLGVVEPGFGVDLWATDPMWIGLTGQCRLGAQVQEAAGFGVYVVPELGLGISDGDVDWVAGGTLQVSAWFGG